MLRDRKRTTDRDPGRCSYNVGSAGHGLMKPALMVVPFLFATIMSQMGNCEYDAVILYLK